MPQDYCIGMETATIIWSLNFTKIRLRCFTQQRSSKRIEMMQTQADIALLDDISRLFRETTGRFGKLDVLVVNADYAKFGSSDVLDYSTKYLSE